MSSLLLSDGSSNHHLIFLSYTSNKCILMWTSENLEHLNYFWNSDVTSKKNNNNNRPQENLTKSSNFLTGFLVWSHVQIVIGPIMINIVDTFLFSGFLVQ